jgi:hypothetical protein
MRWKLKFLQSESDRGLIERSGNLQRDSEPEGIRSPLLPINKLSVILVSEGHVGKGFKSRFRQTFDAPSSELQPAAAELFLVAS